MDFILGVALLSVGLFVGHITANAEAIDKCRKDNNVYHCEMVAVPVKQPKQVE